MDTTDSTLNTESGDDTITLTVKVRRHWMTGGDPEKDFTLKDIKLEWTINELCAYI